MRLDLDEKLTLDEQNSIIPNSTSTVPKTVIELPTKSYADSLHEINRNGRDLSSVYNDQDNEFVKNKLSNLDSFAANGHLSFVNELANKNLLMNHWAVVVF